MYKKIALAAFAAAAMSAMAQTSTTTTTTTKDDNSGTITSQTTQTTDNNWDKDESGWRAKYDTYRIGGSDIGSMGYWDMRRVVWHEMKDLHAADQYELSNFIGRLPSDQASILLKALVNNFKQASMVRDEVAMSRYGNSQTYAWLSNPPLTWSETPGQNSWASVTTTDNGATTTTTTTTTTNLASTPVDSDSMIAMTDDQSRPMRIIMAHRNLRDIDYDRAVSILKSGLGDNEKSTLQDIFHPKSSDLADYTNARPLDAIIHLIDNNAMMVDHIGRYSWYNHFNSDYYGSNWSK